MFMEGDEWKSFFLGGGLCMVNWWLGWRCGFLGSPYERGLLLRGIPRIPNNRARKPPINH